LMLTVAPAENGDEIARRLLKAGALVNARDQHGRTSLMEAAERGNSALFDVLLQAGADVRLADTQGHAALDIARAHGKQSIVERLSRSTARESGFEIFPTESGTAAAFETAGEQFGLNRPVPDYSLDASDISASRLR
jgi:ankyrin repeat protein